MNDNRPNAARRRAIRARLWEVQDCTCGWCKCDLASPSDGELDRIIPGADGGTYAVHNLVLACFTCNRTHGADVRWGRATERTAP